MKQPITKEFLGIKLIFENTVFGMRVLRLIHPTLVESKNVENTGETFLTLTYRSPPTPSFLLSTKVGFTD